MYLGQSPFHGSDRGLWLLTKLLAPLVLLSSYFLLPPFAHLLLCLHSLELKRSILCVMQEGGSQRWAFFPSFWEKGKRIQFSPKINSCLYRSLYSYRLDVSVNSTLDWILWILLPRSQSSISSWVTPLLSVSLFYGLIYGYVRSWPTVVRSDRARLPILLVEISVNS